MNSSAIPSPKQSPAVLSRNLLALRALEDFIAAMSGKPVMVLKGAALILSGDADPRERPMQDVDIMVHPENVKLALDAFAALGFIKRPRNPGQFIRASTAFDLHTGLWYLSAAELALVWKRSLECPAGAQKVLAPCPADHLVYVLAHAAVHHGTPEDKWARDSRALLARVEDPKTIRAELERLGLWPAVADYFARGEWADLAAAFGQGPRRGRLARFCAERLYTPDRGHLQRFLFLGGWKARARYTARALFPDDSFLTLRYDLKAPWQVPVWRCLRPFLLLVNALAALRGLAIRRRQK